MATEAPYHSIVIVGAGISGLTAARELIKQYPDLLVLEARQKGGGRVCEVCFRGNSSCSAYCML